MNRRGFLSVLGIGISAPAIIKVASLMPVKSFAPDFLTLDDYSERILAPSLARNNLLTANMITRESIRLFVNSNVFLQNMDKQYEKEFGRAGAVIGSTLKIRLPSDYSVQTVTAPLPQISAPEAALIGSAAVLSKNPAVSRRFWSAS